MALTNKVIFINDVKQEDEKPVEFTHSLLKTGVWSTTTVRPDNKQIKGVVYVGKNDWEEDIFSIIQDCGSIAIYKGNLNSGKY